MNNQSLRVFMVGIGGLMVGTGLGYMVAERRLSLQFEDRLKRETEEMREFYTIHRKKYPTPQIAVQELVEEQEHNTENESKNGEIIAYHKIVKKEYDTVDGPEGDAVVTAEFDEEDILVTHNVFDAQRDTTKPYPISQEEFMVNDPGYIQSTLTYYSRDKILTDEREEPIEDFQNTVGENFALHFGKDSSDENTVHVRNERLQLDFEIVRSEGSYAVEVLGMDLDEESPSAQRRSARQRRGEE